MSTSASQRGCPGCGGNGAVRSHRRHVGEHAIAVVGYRPYRCSECHTRYFSFSRTTAGVGRRRLRLVFRVVLIGAAFGTVAWKALDVIARGP